MVDLEDNQAIIAELKDIDPSKFTHKEFTDILEKLGINISEFASVMDISENLPQRTAKKNNGILGTKYFHFLIGMIAIKQQASISEIEED